MVKKTSSEIQENPNLENNKDYQDSLKLVNEAKTMAAFGVMLDMGARILTSEDLTNELMDNK